MKVSSSSSTSSSSTHPAEATGVTGHLQGSDEYTVRRDSRSGLFASFHKFISGLLNSLSCGALANEVSAQRDTADPLPVRSERSGDIRLGASSSQPSRLPSNPQEADFEQALNKIRLLPTDQQGGPLESLAGQISLLPVDARLRAFVQATNAIATLAEEQQGALLGVLTRQIAQLPEEARYAAFRRASAASSCLSEEQIGAQIAILVRQIGWLPDPFREPYFTRFADLIPTLPSGQRSVPMEALASQIKCLPKHVRASVRTRVEPASTLSIQGGVDSVAIDRLPQANDAAPMSHWIWGSGGSLD